MLEMAELLAPFSIKVISAAELNLDEPEENGMTFTANAEIKSRAAANASGHVALADDSGLVVPDLDGAPGIYSARWAGPDKDFNQAMQRIKHELEEKGLNPIGARAHFVSVLSLCFPEGRVENFEGKCYGTLTFPARGEKGFGYDPIFIPDGHDRTFAEIPPEEKNRISHRALAFERFIAYVKAQQ